MSALFALLLLAGMDGAPPPEPACKPLVEVMDEIKGDIRPMPPESVQPMLMLHNASPPPSTDTFDAAAIATTEQGVGVVLWMRGDRVCTRDLLPPAAWARLRPIIEGRGT